ncbi:hypothetical protein TTHERM_000460739 (macronuclear) [Tetrahymena thermophila SB210]|uniref:Uncharacterized protein n=1 Tax=Tetrahymena thermophila (strain SB210) TaxID=312017 RepID=W7XIY1_TETTS|nr:hypothetical protein TTHERM_000460739 [Tetrahymena thermophila SB210]EWS73694.1 hypothetical protein TTHERM_000460739 [Tetrahymena thermophila SB210]|eukprot:XP_012653732.1 hypothetical protein TTHERM_000460739 [Tetrahymena thermophila SB210]
MLLIPFKIFIQLSGFSAKQSAQIFFPVFACIFIKLKFEQYEQINRQYILCSFQVFKNTIIFKLLKRCQQIVVN